MKQLVISFFLFLSFNGVLISQNLKEKEREMPKYVYQANKAFSSGNYFAAIPKCESAYKRLGTRGTIREKGAMAFNIAEANRYLSRYEEANKWYGVCIELKYFERVPEVYFYKGNMLKMLGDFQNALKSYES